eukprot:symbB.v1.2.031603.t1/scaffold3687.1/size52011/4
MVINRSSCRTESQQCSEQVAKRRGLEVLIVQSCQRRLEKLGGGGPDSDSDDQGRAKARSGGAAPARKGDLFFFSRTGEGVRVVLFAMCWAKV